MVLIGHYRFDIVLGKGRFGWVSRATHKLVGHNVAVKHQPWAVGVDSCKGASEKHVNCQHVEEGKWRAALENEAKLLKRISHPSIVSLLEIVRKPKELYICLEYLGEITLSALVSKQYKENDFGLEENEVSCIFKQIGKGLNHLHNEGILHRDIKPENIMVIPANDNCEIPVAKIIDLGLATIWDPNSLPNTARSRAGTVMYLAPELTNTSYSYGPEVDVFSFGASMYYSLVGESPFVEYNRNGKLGTTAIYGLQFHHENALDGLSHQAAHLLRNVLLRDPKKRWNLSNVLNHNWFAQSYAYYNKKVAGESNPGKKIK